MKNILPENRSEPVGPVSVPLPPIILRERIARTAWNTSLEYAVNVLKGQYPAMPFYHELSEVKREQVRSCIDGILSLRDIHPFLSASIFLAVACDMVNAAWLVEGQK